ncbi:Small-conductance mechanosensitive channel [archaeon HR01]|nr:Small-conductance mechanosensitive channel [archaeon HR01]
MDVRIFDTVYALIAFFIVFLLIRFFLRRKFGIQHRKVLYLVMAFAAFTLGGYLAAVWKIFELLVGALATAGVLGVVLGFSLIPWISDIFAGIALFLDPNINVGAEVEVGGKRGRVVEIQLTRTKVSGDECIIIIPNRKFRDEIVVIYSTKPSRKDISF